jgi:RHH-type proline utilization regulon transcriptional repressor/proline dehydrogenase/delta 1-pyrroline-5-carboxylate dehydrogenase
VRPLLGRTVPLVISGRRIDTGRPVDSINPSRRNQVVGRVAAARIEDANAAVAAAKAAFPAWRDTTAERRAELLFKSADVMRRRRFELAAWEVFETAKPWREADADVAEGIDYCDYYAREMLRLDAPRRRDVPGESNATFYEPRGVAVTIAPWNFPLAILCGMTAAALVAGNTAIMKPAEQSAVIAAKLMDVFEEAGFPAGVVNYLPGVGEEIGPALVGHPDVSMIAFTGSRGVGLSIQKEAAEVHEQQGQDHIKRVITELGGKNAIIIDDDADLDEAVHGVVASAFGYAGQKCSACSRVVALAGVYDAFLSRLVEATRSLKVGPADDPAYSVGPVIDDDARRRIVETIERGKSEGKLAYSADVASLAEEGCYVGPTIFSDVPPGAKIAQEEIFGPVLAVIRARDLTDALAIANGTKYALTGGVFSRSPANIERVRREFRVGNLYVNRKTTGALVDRQPFGGFKLSGTGPKAGGRDYLPQFMVARTITENTLRRGFAPTESGTGAGAGAGSAAAPAAAGAGE